MRGCGLVVWSMVAGLLSPLAQADTKSKATVNLTSAVIVQPAEVSPRVKKAVLMLRDEVRKRTRVDWAMSAEPPNGEGKLVIIGTRANLKALPSAAEGCRICPDAAEAYSITQVERGVVVVGADERGVLFGVGRLLRALVMTPESVALPDHFQDASAPKVAIRGHQLGYRPKTNSYDAWDLPQWEQYIRDLAVFGTNTVELLPPRTDDDATSPHFPRPPQEMMIGMSHLLDEYGLDVSIWYPAMEPDYTDPKTIASELIAWSEIFSKLPRVDAVFVPGGDPGKTEPKILMPFLEKAAAELRKHHPRAEFWVSPQGFNQQWLDDFIAIVAREPKWLTGVVHGPQVRITPAALRKALPASCPIRSYPDIAHSRQCQHPVPDWDIAYAATEGRESINPRPLAHAAIMRAYAPDTRGFVTYSEGCNDDVNKFVWSGLGWNPDVDVSEILRQYGRYFVGESYAEAYASGLLSLERNWSGPLLTNSGVETTLAQWQTLEHQATPFVSQNWRFQQPLYRAYYDAYLRDRLIDESALESQAREALRNAPSLGAELAMKRASESLELTTTRPVSLDRRARVFALGEALFQSIHMQLDVAHYQAINPERGANLDTIDTPLNNRVWFDSQFAAIKKLATEPERLTAIGSLLHRADPGPGGFYDALGDAGQRPHFVSAPGFASDPLMARLAFNGFALKPEWPVAWRRFAYALYEAPVKLKYEHLDPTTQYKVRVVYSGDNLDVKMRLEADGFEVHPWLMKPDPVAPVEFEVPIKANADGELTLSFTQEPGRGGNGRGNQVAEVWLLPLAH